MISNKTGFWLPKPGNQGLSQETYKYSIKIINGFKSLIQLDNGFLW